MATGKNKEDDIIIITDENQDEGLGLEAVYKLVKGQEEIKNKNEIEKE